MFRIREFINRVFVEQIYTSPIERNFLGHEYEGTVSLKAAHDMSGISAIRESINEAISWANFYASEHIWIFSMTFHQKIYILWLYKNDNFQVLKNGNPYMPFSQEASVTLLEFNSVFANYVTYIKMTYWLTYLILIENSIFKLITRTQILLHGQVISSAIFWPKYWTWDWPVAK